MLITPLAIRKRNQSLLDEEEGSGVGDPVGPPTKRPHTGRVILDAEEVAFAGSLPPLRTTPFATSQYGNVEMEGQDGDGDGDRDGDGGGDGYGDGEGEVQDGGDPGDAEAELGDGNGDDEQDDVSFLNNGVCFLVFLM